MGFCFDHNFLLKKHFSKPSSLLICILAGLRFDTKNDHIYGHNMAIPGMAIMAKMKKMAIMATKEWPYYDH